MQAQEDQKNIISYLKGWPNSFVSGKEIARKVGGRKRYEEDRGWAVLILQQMVRLGQIETDHLGYFKLKTDKDKKKSARSHVSPQLLKILKESGKSFEGIVIDTDNEDSEILTD